jgi:hypothetical protein
MDHAFFGPLRATADGVAWEGRVDLGGAPVLLELTSGADVTSAQLDAVAIFPRDLRRFDAAAREALLRDADDEDGVVRLYIDHHLAEFPAETLASLFGAAPSAGAFLAAMVLHRVALYPDDRHGAAVFDYTLGRDVTTYLLVVCFDAHGAVASLDMES